MVKNISKTIFSIIVLATAFYFSQKLVVPAIFSIENIPVRNQAAQVIPTSGLIGHWKFDGNANDSAGNNHGTLVGGPMFAPGKIGQALSFDGVDDRVALGDVFDLAPGESFTWTGWMKISSLDSKDKNIISKSNGAPGGCSSGQQRYFAIDGSSLKLVFHIGDGVDNFCMASTNAWQSDSDWHHFALVFNANSTASSGIYIDGAPHSVAKTGTAESIDGSSNNIGLNIGSSGDASANEFFPGLLDDIRIYNRVLTGEEISNIYNAAGVVPPPPPPTTPPPAPPPPTTPPPAPVSGISYYASPTGSGTACTSSSPCSLATGLGKVTAGDELSLKNGTYSGTFSVSGNSGTASLPITVRAENRHQAIISGSNTGIGITVSRPYWIFDGLRIRNFENGINLNSNGTVRHSIIENFTGRGIRMGHGNNFNKIHDNVIAFGTAQMGETSAGVYGIQSHNNIVENNIVYSVTNDGHQCGDAGGCSVGQKDGYLIYFSASNNNLIRGNIMVDGAKGALRIYAVSVEASNNIIRDNIIAHNEGGGTGISDANSNFNKIINNLYYGNYYASWDAKGNTPGQNLFQHNTTILTPFSRIGTILNQKIISSLNTTVKDNLAYASFGHSNEGFSGQWLWRVDNWAEAIWESSHNLFWRPGTTAWTRGVTLSSTDIHSSAQRPAFVNEAGGDFALAFGSPGKGSASDGTDRGINYNQYLKQQWAINTIMLPTQEKATNGATSVSFPAKAGRQYQVYFYVPESNIFNGIETFNIDGVSIQRDLAGIVVTSSQFGWVKAAPLRWIYLGTHVSDSTLNISWMRSNSASRIFIRELPTVEEAYQWISGTATTPLPPVPVPTPPAPPPSSPTTIIHQIPGRVEAENYNAGGQNVGYFDTTPGNTADSCRTEDVDIKIVTDEGEDHCTVGYTIAGEWLAYTINVNSSGSYSTILRVANGSSAAKAIHFELNGISVGGSITIPTTGSYNTQTTISGPTLSLTQGVHILKVFFDSSGTDLNWMEFAQASPSPTPTPPPAPSSVNYILNKNFEDSSLTSGSVALAGCVPGGHSIVSSPVRSGTKAVKSTLNSSWKISSPECASGTFLAFNGTQVIRSELDRFGVGTVSGGAERWYGFSVMIDPSWQLQGTNSGQRTIISQWHSNRDACDVTKSPHLSVTINIFNQWEVRNIWDAGACTSQNPPPNTSVSGDQSWNLGPVTKGAWVDWVVYAKWSYNPDGILRVWRDGVLVVEKFGRNTYNDTEDIGGEFHNIGIYSSWWGIEPPSSPITLVAYYDEWKIADQTGSYAAVAPVGTSSLPPLPPTPLPPPPASTKFSIGDRIYITGTSNVNIRQTPGGTLLGQQAPGMQGVVTAGPISAQIGGTGTVFNWWNINFDSGVDGWAGESPFEKVATPTPTPPTPTPPPASSGTSRYVSPSGSGINCTSSSPCSFDTGLNQAQAGDTVILKNGNYVLNNITTVRSGTASQPITITAENRHQARITPAASTSSGTRVFDIRHSNVVLKNIEIDGNLTCCWDGIRILGTNTTQLSGVTVEDMRILNMNGKPMYMNWVNGGAERSIVARWNYFNTTGTFDQGEGFYIGSSSGEGMVNNVQIYANTLINISMECFDIKGPSAGVEIHHNICDGSGYNTVDGLLNGDPNTSAVIFTNQVTTTNSRIHNNIFKNFKTRPYGGCIGVVGGTPASLGNRFDHNVCRDSISPSRAIGSSETHSMPLEIDNNTFCNLFSYTQAAGSNVFNVHNNNGVPGTGAPTSLCNSEEARILAEMALLPGNPGGAVPPPTPTPPPPSSSTKFSAGDRVYVTSATQNIRQSAAGTLLGQQSQGAEGTVIAGPVDALLFSTLYTWWNINFDSGIDGWVADNALEVVVAPPTPIPPPPPPADTTAPIISNISATVLSPTSVRIGWSLNEPATGQVNYGLTTSYGLNSAFEPSFIPSHNQILSNLSPGTTYNYRIRSQDQAGNLGLSINNTFTTPQAPDTQSPNSITNLSASNIQQNSFTLSWTSPSDLPGGGAVASYDLRYSTSPITSSNFAQAIQATGEPTPANPGTTQTYILAGLNPSTTYYVALQSRDSVGNVSQISNVPVVFTLAPPTPPPAPTPTPTPPAPTPPPPPADTTIPVVSITGPAAGTTVSGTVTVSANASDNVGVTRVEFYVDGVLKSTDSSSPYSFSWDTTDGGTHPCSGAHTHTLSATAYDGQNNSGTSAGILVNMNNPSYCVVPPPPPPPADTTPPSIPANLSASAVSTSQINLSWSPSTDNVAVAGYRVERCQGSSCINFTQVTQISSPAITSFSNSGLSSNTTYRYRVRAADSAVNLSNYSAIVQATTQAPPPPPPPTPTPPAQTPPPPPNTPPVVSGITSNVADVNSTLPGLQVFPGSVTYSSSALDGQGDSLTWTWYYTISGGSRISLLTGSGQIQPATFAYASNNIGTTYQWIISVSDGQAVTEQTLNVSVIQPPTPTPPPAPPAPSISLSANPSSIQAGNSSTISWSSVNSTSCTASGAWSGARSNSGSQSTGNIMQTNTYTLMCSGAGGSVTQFVVVSVTPPPPPPATTPPSTTPPVPPPSSGGGGGGGGTPIPLTPSNVSAVGAPNQILLSWDNPNSSDFVRTKVVRKEGSAPTSSSDGLAVYEGDKEEFIDTNLRTGVTYYYAVYSLDRNLNPSSIRTVNARLGQSTEAEAQVQISQQTPVPPSGGLPLLKGPFSLGLRNSEVSLLQQYLSKDLSIYPEALVTGYYGPLTRQAVIRFQRQYGIQQTGIAGPLTRAKLHELYGASVSPIPTPTPPSVTGNLTGPFAVGMRSAQVSILQQYLSKDLSIYPEALVTGYYGPLTRQAVIRFQRQYGIQETGVAGPLTRAKILEVLR